MGYEVVWRLSDERALQRELELAFADSPAPEKYVPLLLKAFHRELQSHPLEWPTSARPPSEHTWRCGGRILVRYRLIPDAQTVEILSVSGQNIHPDATPTI